MHIESIGRRIIARLRRLVNRPTEGEKIVQGLRQLNDDMKQGRKIAVTTVARIAVNDGRYMLAVREAHEFSKQLDAMAKERVGRPDAGPFTETPFTGDPTC